MGNYSSRSKAKGEEHMTMHTYPLNDLREHETDKGAFCWCRPEYDEEYDLYVHRSMDGREEYEEGRKPT